MSAVIIGIDPHKASHTAVALDDRETRLGTIRVRASHRQAEQLLAWAAQWPQRRWAIEGALGLGYRLSQQLTCAGEQVVDVQPKLAARVRLLNTRAVNKNDPNDACSVAVAALRSTDATRVAVNEHAATLKVWVRRRREVARSRNRAANHLHALLCELVPGGFPGEISANQASDLVSSMHPSSPSDAARIALAGELIDDLRRLDQQARDVRTHLGTLVAASGTTMTEIFGVGPVVAATVLAGTGDVTRFATADRFAAYTGTAPIEASSGPHKVYRLSRRGNRQLNHAIHIAAVTQIRNRHTNGRAYYDRKIAEGKSPKAALRALKRRISDAIYHAMIGDARRAGRPRNPGGQWGTTLTPAWPAHTPHQHFGRATPGSTPEPKTSFRPRHTHHAGP